MKKRNSGALALICPLVLFFMVISVKTEAAETLHLGATVPFQYRVGIEIKQNLLMLADLLNKAGGLSAGGKKYTIEYHIYDDKYDADVGRAAAEKLVHEDKVKFMVGPFASNVNLAIVGVTEPNKIPIFSVAASEKLLDPKLKYFVHTYASKYAYGQIKGYIENWPEIKRVLLCSYDDATGHSLCETQEKAHKAFGLTVLPTLYFKRGEMDFTQIAIKAINMKPDLLYCHGINGEAEIIQLVKALKDLGFKAHIHASYMTPKVLEELVARVGKKGVEGLHVIIEDPTLFPESIRPPEAVELRRHYEKYYGMWESTGASWVGNWYTWLAAVKKADSLDPDKVVGAIDRNFEVRTPIGTAKFFTRPDLGNYRYCDYSTMVVGGIIKDGKINFSFAKDADWGIEAIEKVYGVKMR